MPITETETGLLLDVGSGGSPTRVELYGNNKSLSFAGVKMESEGMGTSITREVMNNRGESSFLQLPSPAKWKFDCGSTTVEIGAAETTGAYVTVSHDLGVVPTKVTATANSEEGGIGGVFAEAKELTKTTFKVRACRPFGAPGKALKVVIGWDAVG